MVIEPHLGAQGRGRVRGRIRQAQGQGCAGGGSAQVYDQRRGGSALGTGSDNQQPADLQLLQGQARCGDALECAGTNGRQVL